MVLNNVPSNKILFMPETGELKYADVLSFRAVLLNCTFEMVETEISIGTKRNNMLAYTGQQKVPAWLFISIIFLGYFLKIFKTFCSKLLVRFCWFYNYTLYILV